MVKQTTSLKEFLDNPDDYNELYIINKNIGDEGAKALADALRVSTSIEEIFLIGNKIGDVGAVALAEALKVNNSIKYIDLESNEIGDAGAVALAEAFKVNTSITNIVLYKNNIEEEVGLFLLQRGVRSRNLFYDNFYYKEGREWN